MKITRLVLIAILLLCFTVLLASCNGDDEPKGHEGEYDRIVKELANKAK